MKSSFGKFFSMISVSVALLIFAIGSAIATFIENDYGTETAKVHVYNSFWFEAVMLFLTLALIFNIIRFNLFRKEKLTSLLFHTSFIVIFIGAGITRYFGYEGIMHIREGDTTNQMLSASSYLQVAMKDGDSESYFEDSILLSKKSKNSFEYDFIFKDNPIKITYKDFIPNAVNQIVSDKSGSPIIEIVATSGIGSSSYILNSGDKKDFNNILLSFNGDKDLNSNDINIVNRDGKFFIKSALEIEWRKMIDQSTGKFEANVEYPFEKGRLYSAKNLQFVAKGLHLKAKKIIAVDSSNSSKNQNSALIIDVNYLGNSKEVVLFGRGLGSQGIPVVETISGLDFHIEWGSKIIELPFSLKLNDFQLERYAGSNSPSSYLSEVELIDSNDDFKMPYSIYMNHVLDYKGYRFFQSSYDVDEKGTVLSVNRDPGTLITYIGYSMLTLGLMLNIFSSTSRFRKLLSRTSQMALIFGVVLFGSIDLKASEHSEIEKIIKSIDANHCEKFGNLIVQDNRARFKYLSIYNREILNKISGKSSILGLNSDQVIVGMLTAPRVWQQIKMIKVKHPKLKEILKIKDSEKYFAFKDAFDYTLQNPYLLNSYIVEATRKKPAQRGTFDKEILKIDERINVAYMVYTSDIFKIFPNPIDSNVAWSSPREAMDSFSFEQSNEIKNTLSKYFESINSSTTSGNWSEPNAVLDTILEYQQTYGNQILPSESKLNAELLFYKLNLFYHLLFLYLILGLVLFAIIFAKLFKMKLNTIKFEKSLFYITIFAFSLHTFALILRWYIAGHAPWSNGYESVVYIAWAVTLAGLIFARSSLFALATTNILAAVTLFVANLSWLDPQITNLVPVLNSYWLTIHVSIITASYGFLGLSSLLGFVTLVLFLMLKKDESKNIDILKSIKETTTINEMSMIIGLAMLTIGNFLGGVWANESWGRYWGWDPKETWALISILVYAIILHQRFIPKLNSAYAYAVTSTIAFSSIIMTYFGVNYYLSGMHSYASGDPIPIPSFLYYLVAIIAILIVLAYRKREFSSIKL